MNKLEMLRQEGQSIWYDNIQRALITTGGLENLVDQGVLGMTSNPTIFERAIARSHDYDLSLLRNAELGLSTEKLYEALVIDDIRAAAAVLRPIYESTQGVDGYVSLEVRPTLAHDTNATIDEAKRLFHEVGAPNVMIKVPATAEGVPAIKALIEQGINVNVTLIFGHDNYKQVANAYLEGLEDLVATGGDPARVASVASFFVSRVDTAVDRLLEKAGREELCGKAGIANSKIAYQLFLEIFSGERWKKLQAEGARPQRPLWASTSTKDDRYPDTMYVDALIGPETVNTVPPATLKFFQDHGTIAATLTQKVVEARQDLERLEEAGVDLGHVTEQLQVEGVQAFAESYESLLTVIEAKAEKLVRFRETVDLGDNDHSEVIEKALDSFESESLLKRIWEHDYTLWKPDPKEITNRLGWLDLPLNMIPDVPRLHEFAERVRHDGISTAVLLGMGGSSLAPDVFMRTFCAASGYPDLAVLDSTHPDEIAATLDELSLKHTLFIVSTKSGSTVETLSLFRTMFNRVQDLVGNGRAGSHFVGVTDPGSKLEAIAGEYGFRDLFLNDPNLGGRYSALSYFGLVPAAVIGMDIDELLSRARLAAVASDASLPVSDNPSAKLGALMGEFALAGRDKLTLVIDKELDGFADWLEQLLAESTGKEGKGILPVAHETLLPPDSYRNDRIFAWIRRRGSSEHEKEMTALRTSGQVIVEVAYDDPYDLGALMYLWELATAIAGERLGINPFNQPNVESAKVRAREMVAAFEKEGELPSEAPVVEYDGIKIYSDGSISRLIEKEKSASAALMAFLEQAPDGAYVALQAYLDPTPRTRSALQRLRTEVQKRTRRAVTLGFGPRFLHSTGQLHKGDAGKGMFIQISGEKRRDIPIPDRAGSSESQISFGVLIDAQILGDWQALHDRDRHVLRLCLEQPIEETLEGLAESL